MKGRGGITHGLAEDRVWLSLFTSPARGTRPLIVMEAEKDMDPLISDKLDMNSSHGGKCDPAHHDARADGSSPSRAGARGRGAQRWAQRAAAQVPTQPRPGDPSWCLLVHILGKIPLRGPCPPLLPLPRPLGLACPARRTRWCLPLSVSARGDGAVPPGRCLLQSPQAQQCLKDPPRHPRARGGDVLRLGEPRHG